MIAGNNQVFIRVTEACLDRKPVIISWPQGYLL